MTGLRYISATEAVISSSVEPVTATATRALILQSVLESMQYGGGLLLFAAVVPLRIHAGDRDLGHRRTRRPEQPKYLRSEFSVAPSE